MTLQTAFGPAAVSLEGVRDALGLPRPASVRQMIVANDKPVVLSEPLITSQGVALGGAHEITLHRDGRARYTGHFRATGWPSYDVAVTTRVIGRNGVVAVMAAHGSVHGTNEPGSRQTSWDQNTVSPHVASYWLSFRQARLEHDLQYDSDPFGTVGDVLTFVGKAMAAAYTAGAAGVVIVLGAEATDGFGAHELALPGLVGVIVAGGTLLVLGPSAAFPAFIAGVAAGVVTAALIRQRRLSDEEFAFVDRVFRGTLPRDRIVLSNLLGLGGRPFTAPIPGGAILVNLGDGFDDPIRYTGMGEGRHGVRAAGQLLVHELTHAWQIEHSPFLPWTMCKGIGNQIGTFGGDMAVYRYGEAGRAWKDFNLEEQASIVDEWFSGDCLTAEDRKQHQFKQRLEDDQNPFWRYVRDNIRAGVT